jgi:hypothetical protein
LDVARERSKEMTRHGFTLIDRMLARHIADENRLMPKRLASLVPPERAACLGRLATLEKMGIARGRLPGMRCPAAARRRDLSWRGARCPGS